MELESIPISTNRSMNLRDIIQYKIHKESLSEIDMKGKNVINTINAHSFCLAKKDNLFAEVLSESDVLLPDGSSIVLASRIINKLTIKKIAGADIHQFLLEKANEKGLKVFYLGASSNTLQLIEKRINKEFPVIQIDVFSPPYKLEFTKEETNTMIKVVNKFKPDILFVGMTAPKQEKWVHANKNRLDCKTIACIGAVFDFYAGTVKRAPNWMIDLGMEWLYRLIKEPRRMWRRYLINNAKFLGYIFNEKYLSK